MAFGVRSAEVSRPMRMPRMRDLPLHVRLSIASALPEPHAGHQGLLHVGPRVLGACGHRLKLSVVEVDEGARDLLRRKGQTASGMLDVSRNRPTWFQADGMNVDEVRL